MRDRYAVFGHPVGHSKSPAIHAAFAAATGQDITYEAIEAPLDRFADALGTFFDAGGLGCNVTVPFKIEAARAADDLSDRARLAGASNCLRVEAGRVIAENFDGVGLVTDIEHNLAVPLAGQRVLLLGAGGAARGVAGPILEANVGQLIIANRSPDKAVALAETFAGLGPIAGCGFQDLAGTAPDIVINATSASLGGAGLALPGDVLSRAELAYDMVYGQGLTPFLAAAKAAGVARLADGVGMLVEQAAEAFHWWRGPRPVTTAVIAAIRVPLT